MRRRHIVVEGMDGTGKDTLIDSLMAYKFWPTSPRLHERASTSLGGPVSSLDQWVMRDLSMMHLHPFDIYNRHPLISEPIYAPYRLVNRGLSGLFQSKSWIAMNRQLLCEQAVVVFCVPPWEVVHGNLLKTPNAHMPGVIINARTLYNSYLDTIGNWSGDYIHYNYTSMSKARLLSYVKSYVTN